MRGDSIAGASSFEVGEGVEIYLKIVGHGGKDNEFACFSFVDLKAL